MKKSIAIFGGGPASLAFASFLNTHFFQVSLYEQNKTCGRKFLVAGKGGFNLTHSESLSLLKSRYLPESFLDNALNNFTNKDFQVWLRKIGIETYVGSSKRVFPIKGIKPVEVLDAILDKVVANQVDIKYQMKWNGWNSEGKPMLDTGEEINADYYVYSFGGASWKVTGSNGSWAYYFKNVGIGVNEFRPSNCAFKVDWSSEVLNSSEGQPIKNISVSCGGKTQKGELVLTKFGLEGGAIYALSNVIRTQLDTYGKAIISIDFKPMFDVHELKVKIENSKARNNTNLLKNDLKLSKSQVSMIKSLTSKEVFLDRDQLVEKIKAITIEINGMAPIDEAISTVGGVKIDELSSHFELIKKPKSFCIGEMIDWDAPTGGYLLQGCFSMGIYLADFFNQSRK